jgi:hypothetical protein
VRLWLPYDAAVTPDAGKRCLANVPDVMLLALVASVVADADKPVIAVVSICIAILFAEVTRPFSSTVKIAECAGLPTDFATTPEFGNLAEDKVPEEILLAFVVSVVADDTNVGKSVICEVGIAIATLLAEVSRPFASTVKRGTEVAEPVDVAVTLSARRASAIVPPVN